MDCIPKGDTVRSHKHIVPPFGSSYGTHTMPRMRLTGQRQGFFLPSVRLSYTFGRKAPQIAQNEYKKASQITERFRQHQKAFRKPHKPICCLPAGHRI